MAVWPGLAPNAAITGADQQQLDQHRVLAEGQVDGGNRADGDREQKYSATVAHSPYGSASPTRLQGFPRARFAYIQGECTNSTAIPTAS